jgi:hypothetical protein
MADAGYVDTIPAYSHGGAFRPDPPAFHVIHSTEGPMSAGNARALAGPNWFGGPKAGTSTTGIFDPIEGIRMLDEHTVPYHVGPNGNGLATGDEHCGSVNLTKEQWLSDNGKAMLDRSARQAAQRAHWRGWSLSDCRWLSVSEVAQKTVKGFCTHNDIRLALGGTTHSDPGPNFPYTWYMDRVRFWYQNPEGEPPLQLDAEDRAWITGELKRVGLRVAATALTGKGNTVVSASEAAGFANISAAKIYELLAYGDSRLEVDTPEPHANSIQRTRFELLKMAAQLTAIASAVTQLADSAGTPVDMDAIKATVEQTVEEGLARLDLRIVAGSPTPTQVTVTE